MREQRKIDTMPWKPGIFLFDTNSLGETYGKNFSSCTVHEINAAVLTEAFIRNMLSMRGTK